MNKTVKRRFARTSIESDSLTSFFIPWQKNRAPPIYPNAQTGHVVTPTEFLLFYAAVLLLVLGLGLSGFSIWSVIYKFRYTFLVDCSPELAYFALPAAILCLPCSWIVISVHSAEKLRKFLSLVLIILTFSTVLMIIGVYIGFTHKLYLKTSQIETNPVFEEFRESLRQSMQTYDKNGRVWDEVQAKLGCCGVDNYTDWISIDRTLPRSCCDDQGTCGDNSTWKVGCLKIIATNVALQTYLFSGINSVALFLQCCVFVIVAIIYSCGKNNEEE